MKTHIVAMAHISHIWGFIALHLFYSALGSSSDSHDEHSRGFGVPQPTDEHGIGEVVMGLVIAAETFFAMLFLLIFDSWTRYKKDKSRHYGDERALCTRDHFYYLTVFVLSMILSISNLFIHFEEHAFYWSLLVAPLLC